MITYQKVYTDHVRSSTLMSQLAVLWRNQLMCDAEVVTGSTVIKAHRLVLVASCGIWHSYDETVTGSILEVVLPSDISSTCVNTFLEFLYEGHMILSEDNVREIEKIARLLNVEVVLNCCHDFQKVIKSNELKQSDFRFQELRTVNHVRSTTLVKTVSESSSSETFPNGSSKKSDILVNRRTSEISDASNGRESSDIHKQHSQSSLSFSSSAPSDLHRQMFNFKKHNQNDIKAEEHGSSSHYQLPVNTSHSIVDLTNEASIHSKSPRSSIDTLPYQRRVSDPSPVKSPRSSIESVSYQRQDSHQDESTSNEPMKSLSESPQMQHPTYLPSKTNTNGSMQVSEPHKRQHSVMNRPSSTDSYPSARTLAEKTQNENYSRSLSDEGLDHSRRNTENSLESIGFPVPTIPPNLWDKTLMQYNASQEYFKAYYDGAFGALYAKATEPQAEECTMDLSHSSDQQGSEDGRSSFEAGQIDLSSVKIESCDEPLDLHVDGFGITETVPQLPTADNTDSSINRSLESHVTQSSTSIPNHSLPMSTNQNNPNNQRTDLQPYPPSATARKKPVTMSSNIQKIIQNLQLNRRALASPASLNSLSVGNHRPVRMPGKNNYKVCSLCYSNKIRTKSGYYVYSYYKCSVCDVPLCIGRRKCFVEYHRLSGSDNMSKETEKQHSHD